MKLTFVVDSIDTRGSAADVISFELGHLYNFGYAGRDIESVQHHVDELLAMGLPAPTSVPALFPLPPRLCRLDDTVVVSGADSYGEVEYALVRAGDGAWYVTAASDHSDFAVEKYMTSRAKSVYPDVLAPAVWPLVEVRDVWEHLVLENRRSDERGTEVAQQASVSTLMTPDALIRVLEERTGQEVPKGTVILSGTIAGLPAPGATGWSVSLRDPVRDRSITHSYRMEQLPNEIPAVAVGRT